MTDGQEVLNEVLKEIAEREKYDNADIEIKAISSGGANYTSELYLAVISCPAREELKLFAKVACIGDQMREQLDAQRIYNTEIYVYETLQKIYNDIQDKHEIPQNLRFVFPKFYGYSRKVGFETVVLQDLIADDYKSYNRFQSITWEHAAVIVANLARFHALCFAFEKECPIEYESAQEILKYKMFEINDSFKNWFQTSLQNCVQVVQEEYRERLITFFQRDNLESEFAKFNMPLGKSVFIHGDFRPSNLMYTSQNGELQTLVLDYQMVHGGCPASDLIYFIALGTDEDFRKVYFDKLVDHYHEELSVALNRLSLCAEEVYPKKMFLEEFEEMKCHIIVLSMTVLPIVCVEADKAPKMDDFIENNDSTYIKPNELYASRCRGLISDAVKWGIL